MAKKRHDRSLMLAACAVAFATAVGTPAISSAAEAQAIHKIQRYCTTSWRNAGIRPQEWEDCTQQALVELLSQLSPEDLSQAIEQADSEPRRELNRAVWRLVQRCRRQNKEIPFIDEYAPSRTEANHQEEWSTVERTAEEVLSPRQQQILNFTRDGWRVVEIAAHLGVSSQRVSDEKYKAVTKLRERLEVRGQRLEVRG